MVTIYLVIELEYFSYKNWNIFSTFFYLTLKDPLTPLVFFCHFFVGKIASCNCKTFLNWVIVDWQALILYKYMACNGRGVWLKVAHKLGLFQV